MKREGRLIAEFFVPGAPVPWLAPTVTRTGHTFTPGKVRKWQRVVADHAGRAMGDRRPHLGPVHVVLIFEARRVQARPREVWWAQRPDLCNLRKATEDAMSGIVYLDDRQIVSDRGLKVRSERDGVTVRVVEIGSS